MRKAVYDERHNIFTAAGTVTQNSSERVGSVCLLYRDKGVNMDGVHYSAATDCGLLHINGTVIQTFRELLRRNGSADERIEAYGTWQEDVHRKLGLAVTEEQKTAWGDDARRRSARSLHRRTTEYKVKRAVMRREQKKKRNVERKVASKQHTYKAGADDEVAAESSKPKGKGVVGACACTVGSKCLTKGCPCVCAKVMCTSACHNGRPAPKCVRCIRPGDMGVQASEADQCDVSDVQSVLGSVCSCTDPDIAA